MLPRILCLVKLFLLFTQMGYCNGVVSGNNSTIWIYGLLKSESNFDSVTVKYSDQLVHPYSQIAPPFEKKIPLQYAGFEAYGEKYFRCEVPAAGRPGYLSLEIGINRIISQYLVEPGDSIKIRIDCIDNMVLFGGPDADKFRCQFDMQVATETRDLNMPTYVETFNKLAEFNGDSKALKEFEARYRAFGKQVIFKETSPVKIFEDLVNIADTDYLKDNPAWEVLQQYRNKLNKSFFEILRANLLGKSRAGFIQIARANLGFADSSNNILEKWKKVYSEKFDNWQFFSDPISDSIKLMSVNYMAYLMERISLESNIFEKKPFDIIVARTQNEIRDYLIGYYLLYSNNRLQDGQALFERALAMVRDSSIHSKLLAVYNRDRKGAPIPKFTFWDEKDLPFSINDLKGRVVFVDFWFTGCLACIDFYKNTLKQVEEHYRENKAIVFLTISIDIDKKVWLHSLKNGKYTSADAINWYTGKFSSTHPLIKYFDITGYPHQLLIGGDNKLYRSGDLRMPATELIKILDLAIKDTAGGSILSR